jgi:hypothetical protein
LEDFVKAISNISFQLDNEGNLKLNSKYPNPYNDKAEFLNILLQQLKMFRFDNRVKIPSGDVSNKDEIRILKLMIISRTLGSSIIILQKTVKNLMI